jgi:DNA-directed RNA polymerase subunit RPC12/RpoP
MVNCNKCKGLLVRDYGAEHETRSKPSYKCVNCGKRIDMRVVINSKLTIAQQSVLVERSKRTSQHRIRVLLEQQP